MFMGTQPSRPGLPGCAVAESRNNMSVPKTGLPRKYSVVKDNSSVLKTCQTNQHSSVAELGAACRMPKPVELAGVSLSCDPGPC